VPDISMCSDWHCPKAHRCRRSEMSGTEPSDHQAYAHFERDPNAKQCVNILLVETNDTSE
jgi:hypothetical protein